MCDNDEANTVDFRSSDSSHDAKLSLMSHTDHRLTIETLLAEELCGKVVIKLETF